MGKKSKDEQVTICYIRWVDSSITRGEPCTPDEAAGLSELESCGLLIMEGTKSITIALDRSLSSGNLRCTLCIPLVNIVSIKRWNV